MVAVTSIGRFQGMMVTVTGIPVSLNITASVPLLGPWGKLLQDRRYCFHDILLLFFRASLFSECASTRAAPQQVFAGRIDNIDD